MSSHNTEIASKLAYKVSDMANASGTVAAAINGLSAKVTGIARVAIAADTYNEAVSAVDGAPVMDVTNAVSNIIGGKLKEVVDNTDNIIAAANEIKKLCATMSSNAPASGTPVPGAPAPDTHGKLPTLTCTHCWTHEDMTVSLTFAWNNDAKRYAMQTPNSSTLMVRNKTQDIAMYCVGSNPMRVIEAHYDESSGEPTMVHFYKFSDDSDKPPKLDGTITEFD